ncbi:MAG: hypothetical protein IGS03_17465 [Candidatus Sericytochromatia bacterium]|nr:hypothetical protein [Candidatus Sericytochromatia bacterium]
MKIFVGNLAAAATEADLETLARQVAEPVAVSLASGHGFIEMASAADAEALIAKANGTEIQGQAVKLSPARPEMRVPGKSGAGWQGIGGKGVPGSGQQRVKGNSKGKGGFNQAKGSSNKV